MPFFEIETATDARFADVVVLSQKNREPDDNPGAKLSLEVALGNAALAAFDGFLLGALFTKNANQSDAQGSLDGVAPISDRPNLTNLGRKLGRFRWDLELTGYTLHIEPGLGGRSAFELDSCVLDSFRLHAQEGGTVLVTFNLETPDVTEAVFGRLATLKTRSVPVQLHAPEPMDDEQPEAA